MAKKQEIQDSRFQLYERAHTKEYYAVAKWLSEVSFTPAIFGADQADVWRKIEKLCELYEAAIDAERARNAKLERKLRSLTAVKSSVMHTNPEQPKAVQEPRSSESAATVDSGVVKDHVRSEISQTVAQVLNEKPRTASGLDKSSETASKINKSTGHDEEILLDLIREFGPDKGGKVNG